MKKRMVAVFALACCTVMLAGGRPPLEKPNIVLLFVDDLGWNNLGFRNPDLFETPNIDQLAKDGIDFQQCYVAGPVCSPSRATLLTGKHPARLKMVRHVRTDTKKGVQLIYDDQGRPSHHILPTDPAQFPSKNRVDLEHVSYARALKKQGYYNLFLGKWHIGEKGFYPVDHGFDRQIGTTDHGAPKNYYPDYFKDTDILDEKDAGKYLTDRLTDELVGFIHDWDEPQPLMVSMWYYNVHSPNIGRKDLLPHFENRAGLREEPKRVQFAAQVMAMDESVGRVRAALKEKGMDKNTVILFTSDQGSLYEWAPYRGGKRIDTLCEGGARVPFIVSWPGVAKAGGRNNSIVQTTDIFPTLVELTGGNPSNYDDLDGVSLVSTIKNNSTLKRAEPIYGYRAYEDLYASVREGDWKLLGYRDGRTSLYNLKNDRVEQDDLAMKHPEKVRELVEKLRAWEVEMGVEAYSGFKK
ncbi:sulfatase [Pontiellaceae bacterium B12227]|nr:sulfatase [Pontiellaceae bacterium B12227]